VSSHSDFSSEFNSELEKLKTKEQTSRPNAELKAHLNTKPNTEPSIEPNADDRKSNPLTQSAGIPQAGSMVVPIAIAPSWMPQTASPDPAACEHDALQLFNTIQPHGILIGVVVRHEATRSHEADCLEPIEPIESIEPAEFRTLTAPRERTDLEALTIVYVSANLDELVPGCQPADYLDRPLSSLLPATLTQQLTTAINPALPAAPPLRFESASGQIYDVSFHQNPQGVLILEFERSALHLDPTYFVQAAQPIAAALQQAQPDDELLQTIVREMRTLTGFDRVMLYRFEEDLHGVVIAEDRRADLESFLGLHYPCTDIPMIARQLFLDVGIRSIVDVEALPIPLLIAPSIMQAATVNDPITDTVTDTVPNTVTNTVEPYAMTTSLPDSFTHTTLPDGSYDLKFLDLSHALLRSVSPGHVEYLNNMGVRSSSSIALTAKGKLWGIIACHHNQPRTFPYPLRQTCDFLRRMMSSHLVASESKIWHRSRQKQQQKLQTLLNLISQATNWGEKLAEHGSLLLDLVQATGVIIGQENYLYCQGNLPQPSQVRGLIRWVRQNIQGDQLVTQALHQHYPPARHFQQVASGLMAIATPNFQSFIIWLRPETIQTVNWAGNPYQENVQIDAEGVVRLSPRASFALWRESVHHQSLPWKPEEQETALQLRDAIATLVLRQSSLLAKISEELKRSNAELEKFAYVASHDLQEPLNLVSHYIQFLELRYHQKLDDEAREYIKFAVEGTTYMQSLIDELLVYSRVSTRGQPFIISDLNQLLDRALRQLQTPISETQAQITIPRLPTLKVDPTQIEKLFFHLIQNSLRFHRNLPPKIDLCCKTVEDNWQFSIQDNGIGIESEFTEQIFTIFQRLHTREKYPGTGVGLAICRKIIERHHGRIWVESQLGVGSTFFFTLPQAMQ